MLYKYTITFFQRVSLLITYPLGGRPGLPGIAVESTVAATVAANGRLLTWGFKHITKPRKRN